MEIQDRFVTLDGLRFHYREAGDPEAHTVVLLHALGASCADWNAVAAALAGRHRVLAFELRGSHDSARSDRYSFELMRDDVRAFADELGLSRFSLVGHSMGGTVSYLFAEEWPERLDRLALEDTPPPAGGSPPLPAGEPPAGLPFDHRMALAIVGQLSEPDPAWWGRLGEISVPTLVIAGGPDSHVPQVLISEVAERIPDARVVTLGGGHHVHRNRFEEFVAALSAFLD